MIRACRPITFSEHQGATEGPWEITLMAHDRLDEAQGPQYLVDVDVLAQHDGLDRALVDAGLTMAQRIPWGERGEQLVFVDRRPVRLPWASTGSANVTAEPLSEDTPSAPNRSSAETDVLSVLENGPTTWIDLIRYCHLPMNQISAAVTSLKRAGLVVQEGKEYRRAG